MNAEDLDTTSDASSSSSIQFLIVTPVKDVPLAWKEAFGKASRTRLHLEHSDLEATALSSPSLQKSSLRSPMTSKTSCFRSPDMSPRPLLASQHLKNAGESNEASSPTCFKKQDGNKKAVLVLKNSRSHHPSRPNTHRDASVGTTTLLPLRLSERTVTSCTAALLVIAVDPALNYEETCQTISLFISSPLIARKTTILKVTNIPWILTSDELIHWLGSGIDKYLLHSAIQIVSVHICCDRSAYSLSANFDYIDLNELKSVVSVGEQRLQHSSR